MAGLPESRQTDQAADIGWRCARGTEFANTGRR
jgi:hypothetical protein